jgi:hypothetical protein
MAPQMRGRPRFHTHTTPRGQHKQRATVRVVQHHGHEDGFILALRSILDFTNAFNLVYRVRLMEQVCALCPAILEYTQVCYGGCAHMFVGHSMVEASLGVHQGDPLGPLLFALFIHPLISSLHARFTNLLNALVSRQRVGDG